MENFAEFEELAEQRQLIEQFGEDVGLILSEQLEEPNGALIGVFFLEDMETTVYMHPLTGDITIELVSVGEEDSDQIKRIVNWAEEADYRINYV